MKLQDPAVRHCHTSPSRARALLEHRPFHPCSTTAGGATEVEPPDVSWSCRRIGLALPNTAGKSELLTLPNSTKESEAGEPLRVHKVIPPMPQTSLLQQKHLKTIHYKTIWNNLFISTSSGPSPESQSSNTINQHIYFK